VIDLSLTKRVDATGANALLRTVRQAKALGVEVSIVNPNPTIRLRSQSTSDDAA
jgi:anti-anti-sigma regulatory factor